MFYTENLKLHASGERELKNVLRVVQEYMWAIEMEFGLDKCAAIHLKRWRCREFSEDAQLAVGSILRHLDAGENYAYLCVQQRHIQNVQQIKESFRGKYSHRLL